MFGAFTSFGKLGSLARAIAAAWSPLSLWPTGTEPGMWIDPSALTSQWQDSTGTTPVSTPGTVADSSNPVGLALDLRLGATTLTDPGNHLLQATSTARPLLSARVNLLPSSESLTWMRNPSSNIVLTAGQADPFGGTDAVLLAADTADTTHGLDSLGAPLSVSGKKGLSFYAKPSGVRYLFVCIGLMQWNETYLGACFDLSGAGAVVSTGAWTESADISVSEDGFYLCKFQSNQSDTGGPAFTLSQSSTLSAFVGNGVDGVILSKYDCRLGAAASTISEYQAVVSASDYDATSFPVYQHFDGTDDGMATASFAAGTLINGMDCLIAVRRDSGANAVCGLYESVAEANKVFGIAESGSSSGCVGSGAGTPTVWVDGTQLTGGTAVTRGTLHTALTVGSYHILEFRNLDLSTWTATGFGLYTSYVFPGARGDIMLFESTASTEDKDAARQYLANKYGVTLP